VVRRSETGNPNCRSHHHQTQRFISGTGKVVVAEREK
jgi:hypothetical protein